jgi:hypothetical protein
VHQAAEENGHGGFLSFALCYCLGPVFYFGLGKKAAPLFLCPRATGETDENKKKLTTKVKLCSLGMKLSPRSEDPQFSPLFF